MFLQEDGKSFFDENKIVGNTICFKELNFKDVLGESTFFSREITAADNQMCRDVLLQFSSDYYEYLKKEGLNKFVTKTKSGMNIGPIHIKNAEELIIKNYNKIASSRRGCYDLELYRCNLNDERTTKELYDLSWEFIKQYNGSLPDVNIRILPVYKESEVQNTDTYSGEVNGKVSKKGSGLKINPFNAATVLGRVKNRVGKWDKEVGGKAGYEHSTQQTTKTYTFYVKIESDTFKVR